MGDFDLGSELYTISFFTTRTAASWTITSKATPGQSSPLRLRHAHRYPVLDNLGTPFKHPSKQPLTTVAYYFPSKSGAQSHLGVVASCQRDSAFELCDPLRFHQLHCRVTYPSVPASIARMA